MKAMNANSTTQPISIRVHRSDLKSVIGNGLAKVNFFYRKKIFPTWKRVSVEGTPAGRRDSVFFAPDKVINNTCATPTEFVNIYPGEHKEDLVHQGDNFEISFVGMNVAPQDGFAWNKNELLLWSLTKDPPVRRKVALAFERGADPSRIRSSPVISGMSRNSKTGLSPAPTDNPFIHYDPVEDGHNVGDEPDSFVPVPASKALYLQSRCNCRGDHKKPDKRVSIRFTLMEIDEIRGAQIRAIVGLHSVGGAIGKGAVAMPYLELLSGAFEVAASLGKKGLEKYSRPDHVLSKDVEFELAPAEHDIFSDSSDEDKEADPRGCYLRYGYYFFLDKTVDAKLYAQTSCSTQYVPLLLKREKFDPQKARKNETEYFPLTGMNYVVVKVSRGIGRSRPSDLNSLGKGHKRRLDSMLEMNKMMKKFGKFEAKNREPSFMGKLFE